MRRAGLALALLYTAVAAVTHVLVPEAGRPLFDGFAPPPPYNYVSPPPELASANFPPQAARTAVTVGEAGSEPINASTPDAQAIVTLPAGAIAANPPDTSVAVELTPLAPATLGPLPPDLRPVGNVYQLGLAYQPSGTAVAAVAPSATVALTGATQGDTLLFSGDGQAWRTVAARPFGNTHGMTGPAQGPGYYLVAASPALTPPTTAADDSGGGAAGAAALVLGGLATAGVAVYIGVARRRRRQERARARARQRRRQQRRKSGRRR
ncbi:MAG TPA: hypothetical protein VF045_04180 [Acidimicrobiales bacterium]